MSMYPGTVRDVHVFCRALPLGWSPSPVHFNICDTVSGTTYSTFEHTHNEKSEGLA